MISMSYAVNNNLPINHRFCFAEYQVWPRVMRDICCQFLSELVVQDAVASRLSGPVQVTELI